MHCVGKYECIGTVGWPTVWWPQSIRLEVYRQDIVAEILHSWLKAVRVLLIIAWDVYSQLRGFVISIFSRWMLVLLLHKCAPNLCDWSRHSGDTVSMGDPLANIANFQHVPGCDWIFYYKMNRVYLWVINGLCNEACSFVVCIFEIIQLLVCWIDTRLIYDACCINNLCRCWFWTDTRLSDTKSNTLFTDNNVFILVLHAV